MKENLITLADFLFSSSDSRNPVLWSAMRMYYTYRRRVGRRAHTHADTRVRVDMRISLHTLGI